MVQGSILAGCNPNQQQRGKLISYSLEQFLTNQQLRGKLISYSLEQLLTNQQLRGNLISYSLEQFLTDFVTNRRQNKSFITVFRIRSYLALLTLTFLVRLLQNLIKTIIQILEVYPWMDPDFETRIRIGEKTQIHPDPKHCATLLPN